MTELLGISSLSKEELRSCKEAGIEGKNLLIQAVAASRKGTFFEFLNLFQTGALKTVKDAKSFNREEENLFTPKIATNTNSKTSNSKLTEYKITKNKASFKLLLTTKHC